MLPAQYAEQGLCNGRVSVRPSVCPVDRQQQRRAAGLLMSVGIRYQSIATDAVHRLSINVCCPRSAATAGSISASEVTTLWRYTNLLIIIIIIIMLRAKARGSTHTGC